MSRLLHHGQMKQVVGKKINRQFVRTAVGVSLVVVSVAVVGFITTDSSDSQIVLVAQDGLVQGQALTAADVAEVRMPANPSFDPYLSSVDQLLGLYANQSVGLGELVPRSVLVEDKPNDDAVVTLELRIGNPAWLRSGVVAELWVSPLADTNSYAPPFVVSPQVVVVDVTREDGFAADQTTSRVDVLIPRRHLPSVLHALANQHVLHLTAVGG